MSEWQSDGKSPMFGKKISEEHYKKLKCGLDKWKFENGEPFKGRKHRGETKKKMRDAMLSQIENGSRRHIASTKSKTVYQYSLDGKYIRSYDTIKDALEQTNGSRAGIYRCCNGKGNSSGGYLWKYEKEVM